MNPPNYNGGSNVNLMSSISQALGTKHPYPQLQQLPSAKLKNKKIILLTIDGLGYYYLKQSKDNFLKKNLKGKMDAAFPSTTATSAIVFTNGVPAQQHGLTGWYTYLKELGEIIMPLTYLNFFGQSISENKNKLLKLSAFESKLKVKACRVMPKGIINSEYQKKEFRYSTLRGMFTQLRKAVKKYKYIYAYTDLFDHAAHEWGVNHKETKAAFQKLSESIEKFSKTLPKNTILIVTADHGFADNAGTLLLTSHPKITECLIMPVSGDSRVAYCYLRPDKVSQFKTYVNKNLSKYVTLHKSADLVKKNYFGLGKPHPSLKDRIGDYTLIAKNNYVIAQKVPGKKSNKFKGFHSGTSKEETKVPLIIIENN